MAKLTRLEAVGISTRDQKRARQFFTKSLGLTVRNDDPKFGYLQLGATKGGTDAGLEVWQPTREWGQEMYEAGLKQIGAVTGIGFSTGNLEKTVEQLAGKGVKVEKESEGFARFWDLDQNAFFLSQAERPKVRRAGIRKLEWVTVVTRNLRREVAFFTKSLGLKSRTIRGGEEGDFTVCRVSPDQTSVMPFTPSREMYRTPSDYDADMAHIGEETSISFLADDVYAVQEKLLQKGVEFKSKAEKRDWGGVAARIYDPDRNTYMIYHMERQVHPR